MESTYLRARLCPRSDAVLSYGMTDKKTDRLMTRAEVSRRVGLGRSAIYAAMDRGDFPRPFRLSPKAVRWSEREVENWITKLPKSNGARGQRAA